MANQQFIELFCAKLNEAVNSLKEVIGYTLALIITLIFPPLGVVAGLLAFWFHWESNNSDNQKVRREVQNAQDARETYEREKWRQPLTENTKHEYKKAAKSSISAFGLTDHQSFLDQQITFVESKFESHGASLFGMSLFQDEALLSIDVLGGSEYAEKIASELITSPARYIEICSETGRKPIPELIDLWKDAISANQKYNDEFNTLLTKKSQERFDSDRRLAHAIRTQIQDELDVGYDWKGVLENAQQALRQAGNKTLSVSRVNGVWKIRSRGGGPEISLSLKE